MAKNEPMAKATSASGAADGSVLSETLCPYRSEFPNGSKGNDKNQATEKVQRKKTKPLKPLDFSDFLVAEMGFEPHDLRVMSPTSYQAALLRDIKF